MQLKPQDECDMQITQAQTTPVEATSEHDTIADNLEKLMVQKKEHQARQIMDAFYQACTFIFIELGTHGALVHIFIENMQPWSIYSSRTCSLT